MQVVQKEDFLNVFISDKVNFKAKMLAEKIAMHQEVKRILNFWSCDYIASENTKTK